MIADVNYRRGYLRSEASPRPRSPGRPLPRSRTGLARAGAPPASARQRFGINLEQNLTRNVTAFACWGWDDGRTESFAYSEIDSTFNQGIGVKGAQWHRKQDRAGVAFVSNDIKKDHQIYLADGGNDFLLGDGKLNYGRENIVESYYTAHIFARSLSRSRSAVHRQPRLQPRPRPDGGAKPPGSRGILEHSSQFSVLGLQCSNCKTHASTVSRNSGVLLFYRLYRPSHARSIVGNPETSLSIQQNDSPAAVEALLQIVHRFRRHPLG